MLTAGVAILQRCLGVAHFLLGAGARLSGETQLPVFDVQQGFTSRDRATGLFEPLLQFGNLGADGFAERFQPHSRFLSLNASVRGIRCAPFGVEPRFLFALALALEFGLGLAEVAGRVDEAERCFTQLCQRLLDQIQALMGIGQMQILRVACQHAARALQSLTRFVQLLFGLLQPGRRGLKFTAA